MCAHTILIDGLVFIHLFVTLCVCVRVLHAMEIGRRSSHSNDRVTCRRHPPSTFIHLSIPSNRPNVVFISRSHTHCFRNNTNSIVSQPTTTTTTTTAKEYGISVFGIALNNYFCCCFILREREKERGKDTQHHHHHPI